MTPYTYPPVGFSLDAMLKKITSDMGETLWRCDLASLGERVFELDIYRHGPKADKDGQGLALRKLHKSTDGPAHFNISQPDAPFYMITSDAFRLRLRPEDTDPGSYTTCEWAAGPCMCLDEVGLIEGGLAMDPRVVLPGRGISFRLRCHPSYQAGTALGTAGMVVQDFKGHEDPKRKYFDYTFSTIVYLGPEAGMFGRLLGGRGKPGFIALTADYTTDTMWFKRLPHQIDISEWHTYTIEWAMSGVRYRVDGKAWAHFKQGQRTLNLGLLKGQVAMPFKRGFVIAGPMQPDVWIDNNMPRKATFGGYSAFREEQWLDLDWVETFRLPLSTWFYTRAALNEKPKTDL